MHIYIVLAAACWMHDMAANLTKAEGAGEDRICVCMYVCIYMYIYIGLTPDSTAL